MSQIISCPDCRRKLRVPVNLLGKKVKCPSCGVKFVGKGEQELDELEEVEEPTRRAREEGVTAKPSKSRRADYEEDEDDDAPARRRRREEEPDDEDIEPQKRKPKKRDVYKGWERVRFGINLVAVSLWIAVGGVVGIFLLTCLVGALIGGSMSAMEGAPNRQRPPAGAVAGASIGVLLIAGLTIVLALSYIGTQLTGLGYCMGVVTTPKTQGLKGLAIASFSLAAGGMLARMFSYAANMIPGVHALAVGGILGWSTSLISLAEFVCFLLFLRGVAVAMRRDDLAKALVTYMIIVGVIIGLCVISSIILMFAGMMAAFTVAQSPGDFQRAGHNLGGAILIGCVLLLLMAGVSLALFIRFFFLLYQVRSAVDRWLNRN